MSFGVMVRNEKRNEKRAETMIMWMFKDPFGLKLFQSFWKLEIFEREYHVSTNSTRTTYNKPIHMTTFNTFRVAVRC